MATIITKNSTGSGVVPSSLVQGELAINTVDGRLFYGSGSGDEVKEFTGTSINTGSFVTTSSFNTFTSSINTFTSSIQTEVNSLIASTSSYTTTSSFNTFTGSYYTDSASFDSRINNINIDTSSLVTTSSFNTFTSSINTFTSSIQASVNSLTSKTGSYATTGSNTFIGNQIITGSLSVSESVITQKQFSGGIGNFTYNTGLSGAGSFSGNIIKFGSTATAAGRLYNVSSSGDWVGANASSTTTSTSLLAISVGTNSSTDGMVLTGLVVVSADPGGNSGDVLYVDTNEFRITATAPTGSGNVVRKVGHKLSATRIYFNPSLDHVVIS